MKKLFVLAVLLVVIGVLCAVFFLRGGKEKSDPDDKPWTVGAQTTAAETTEAATDGYADAVEAFSDYVHTNLRADYDFLSKEDEKYSAASLPDSLLSVYIYDMDADGEDELSVVRADGNGVTLDVYEYNGGKVQFADSEKLLLDPMDDTAFSLKDDALIRVQARLSIFPSGADRFFCLTVEQQDKAGEYDAYTIVLEYAEKQLSVKKSYRLRQTGSAVSFVCTDSVTLLYSQASGGAAEQPAEETTDLNTEAAAEAVTEQDVDASPAKYTDLRTAFETEFEALGLNAPQVAVENGQLTQYKVSAVDSEQHLFDLTIDGTQLSMAENGFLQSFILRK